MDEIPPPGKRRDEEIERLLGGVALGSPSTHDESCDRLIHEMIRRGYWFTCSFLGVWSAWFVPAGWAIGPGPVNGLDPYDAVSSAALVALRAGPRPAQS